MKLKNLLFVPFVFLCFFAQGQHLFSHTNEVVEWSYYSSTQYADPFNEVDLWAEITKESGEVVRLPAFWAGKNKWSFRFSSPHTGQLKFKTICNDSKNKELHGKTGIIEIERYQGTNDLLLHGPLKVASNKRHLEHSDGTPFFWLADSWWHGMTTRFKWPEDFAHLTLDRKQKGFSVIQFAIAFPCDIAPFDPRGMNEAGNPWDDEWKSIRPEYFDFTDKRVQYLVDEGMVPNIVGVWGYYMKFAGAEKLKKHWQYLIARYGAYPVTYTLCGESTLAWYDDLGSNWEEQKTIFRREWSKVAAFIQETDPYNHILTVHPGPNSGNFLPIGEMEHIDMVMLQSGHNGYFTLPESSKAVAKALDMYPGKPIMHGEVCFEGMEGKSLADVQRYLFWSNMLKSTCGFSYGVEGIWQFNTEEELFGVSPGGNTWGNVSWEVASQYPGSAHVGIGKQILENYQWWNLVPAQNRVDELSEEILNQPVCAEIPEVGLITYLFRKPSGWLKYSFNGFKPNIQVSATFWDPITGERYDDLHFMSNSDGIVTINNAPIMQDWVVLLHHQ